MSKQFDIQYKENAVHKPGLLPENVSEYGMMRFVVVCESGWLRVFCFQFMQQKILTKCAGKNTIVLQ